MNAVPGPVPLEEVDEGPTPSPGDARWAEIRRAFGMVGVGLGRGPAGARVLALVSTGAHLVQDSVGGFRVDGPQLAIDLDGEF